MRISLTLQSPAAKLRGFRYWWAKRVRGFDSSQHCARCLVGDYVKGLGNTWPASTPVHVDLAPGEWLYLCGVSTPYRWEHNFHAALRPNSGNPNDEPALLTWAGDTVWVAGADVVPIDAEPARARFPTKGAAFLTCRNFQFGAQHFE